jgi:hypothetical protein
MATLIGSLTVVLTAVMALSSTAVAWNIPAHMLSAIITYQVLNQENPETIDKVKSSVGETPVVREPMAGEASRRSGR